LAVAATGEFTNWTRFKDPSGVDLLTHFEGISSTEAGVAPEAKGGGAGLSRRCVVDELSQITSWTGGGRSPGAPAMARSLCWVTWLSARTKLP